MNGHTITLYSMSMNSSIAKSCITNMTSCFHSLGQNHEKCMFSPILGFATELTQVAIGCFCFLYLIQIEIYLAVDYYPVC